ncbi:MAG TPA: type II toxin-antitoxin system VapC family toxin [Candidatus Dormibacteraeota bacterium]|nr:type II toxin-antitoxin system VapC family toxin [Candidatus Dormibacteraeota bacterium]
MRLLLDTHTLLWWLSNDPSLTQVARAAIGRPEADVAVSAASAWEVAIKTSLGKLTAPPDLEAQLTRHRFTPLPITVGHALVAGSLPRHHDDPFDRMLVAQARLEGMTLVTRDLRIGLYGVPTIPA